MTEPPPTAATNGYAVFAAKDYAGLWRRLAVLAVDFVVICIAGVFFFAISTMGSQSVDAGSDVWIIWLWWFTYAYLVVLKPSPIRTIGFRVLGVRIVNQKGSRPSIFRMTFRFLFWTLGPFNPILDFFWLSGDPWKQTLRDKFAGTYVIMQDAAPIGYGKRKAAYYTLMGWSLVVFEVPRPDLFPAQTSLAT